MEAGAVVEAVVAVGVVQEAESNKLKCNLMYRIQSFVIPLFLEGSLKGAAKGSLIYAIER